jgi:hypothetical protein
MIRLSTLSGRTVSLFFVYLAGDKNFSSLRALQLLLLLKALRIHSTAS